MNRRTITLLGALVVVAGCQGVIGDTSDGPDFTRDPDGNGGGDGEGGGAKGLCVADESDVPGPRMLRRLTTTQVEVTVRAIFGLTTDDWSGHALPPDAAASNGFTNNADRLVVNDTFAARLRDMGEDVGEIVSVEPHLSRVLPCAPAADRACAETYLDTIGRRVYRRALTAAEKARYLALYDDVTSTEPFGAWVKWATMALLQSPHAIYRSELGEVAGGEAYRLTPDEVATALAFTYTGAPPDGALLDRAASGGLDDPDAIRAAATELAFDGDTLRPAAEAMRLDFVERWLGLSGRQNLVRDATMFPGFDATVKASMEAELRAFVRDVLIAKQGGVDELLTAPYTFLDPTLAAFYGFGAPSGAGFAEVARPEGWGVGLLALGAVQTVHAHVNSTSPTKRGHLVRSRLLCEDIPPPPATITPIPEPSAAATTRQRYEEMHATESVCADCHHLMDPVGFGFEGLDAVGRFRATENGVPIDATGYLADMAGEAPEIPFDGPDELAHDLAEDPAVHRCFAAVLASDAYGLLQEDTRCMVSTPADAFARGELTVGDLLVELATTPHFLERR